MTKYRNPFEYEQATTLPRDFVNQVFIEDHSFTRFIQSTRNVLLSGERGSGKSMTLLYNSLTFRESKEHVPVGDRTDYLGIYIACNTALTHKREWELFEDKDFPQIVSEHFMVLAIAHAIVQELTAVSPTYYNVDGAPGFREDMEYILGRELKEGVPTLKALLLFLERESYRSQTALNALKHQEFRTTAFTFSSLVQPLLLALRRTEPLKRSHFLLLLDDAHDLNPFQKRTLNSWLAYRDRSAFSLKVAVADLQSYDFSTISGGSILEGHDFLVVDLQKPFQSPSSDFGKMARNIIERRLKILGLDASAAEFFPPSHEFEGELAHHREGAQREAEGLYPDSGDAKRRKDYVYKYSRSKYFQNRNPKSNLPPYSGIDTITHLSTGVIRNLLMPCYWMYDAVFSETNTSEQNLITQIPPDIQSKVILDRSTRLWGWVEHSLASAIDNCTLEDAKRVYRLLDQLGVLFRDRLMKDISEPRAIAFSISGWSEEYEGSLLPILNIARRAQLLYLRNGPAKDEGRRETYYVPNRLLWPIRGLDIVGQHARVSLRAKDIWAAANGTPFRSDETAATQGGLFDE